MKQNQLKNYNFLIYHLSEFAMQQSELLMLEEFSSNLHTIEDVLSNRISNSLKISKIAVNYSPAMATPLFCEYNEKNTNHIPIQKLLKLFVDRWRKEIQYQQEIILLKDQIFQQYDEFCNKINNEQLINLTRKECEQVVETLFSKINFDYKQLSGEFCKSFMNGFENEMIEKIDYYVTYVVFVPFIAPFPEGLIDFTIKTLHHIAGENSSQENIINASKNIIKFAQDQLSEKEIQIENRSSGVFGVLKKIREGIHRTNQKNIIQINELSEFLQKAQKERKGCFLLIKELGAIDKVVQNERLKIQTICVRMNAKEFLKATIPFTYEHLEITNFEDFKDFKVISQILNKQSKCLEVVTFIPKNNKLNELSVTKQIEIDKRRDGALSLNFTQYNLTYNQIQTLTDFLYTSTIPVFLIIHNFTFDPLEKVTAQHIENLSKLFVRLKTLRDLHLCFKNLSIENKVISTLANSLDQMVKMENLDIDFGADVYNTKTSGNDNCIKLFSHAIKKMINLNYLNLSFQGGNNAITDAGIISLSEALAETPRLTTLKLNFNGGKNFISDNGIQHLSERIIQLIKLQNLMLRFGNGRNFISDIGITKLSASIAILQNLQDVNLQFDGGNNCISDNGIQHLGNALAATEKRSQIFIAIKEGKNKISDNGVKFLADSLAKLKPPFEFECHFLGHPNTVTTASINYLNKVKNSSKIKKN